MQKEELSEPAGMKVGEEVMGAEGELSCLYAEGVLLMMMLAS